MVLLHEDIEIHNSVPEGLFVYLLLPFMLPYSVSATKASGLFACGSLGLLA